MQGIERLVINGASGSIGHSIVKIVCEGGGRVIGIGRNSSVLAKMKSEFPQFTPFEIQDVASSSEALKFQDFMESEFSNSVTTYMHVAGIFERERDPIAPDNEIWNSTISTNLTGMYIWNKVFVNYFSKAQIPGSIVNVSSQAALTGGFGPNFSYAASKGGIISLSKSISRYAAQYEIRVNTVVPGFVKNEMMLDGLSPDEEASFVQRTSLKRLAFVEEIARACIYLGSQSSSYSTGIVLDVTGGLLDV